MQVGVAGVASVVALEQQPSIRLGPPPYWDIHQMILLHHVFTLAITPHYEEEQDSICNRTMIKP